MIRPRGDTDLEDMKIRGILHISVEEHHSPSFSRQRDRWEVHGGWIMADVQRLDEAMGSFPGTDTMAGPLLEISQ